MTITTEGVDTTGALPKNSSLSILREALALLLSVADSYSKRKLLLTVAVVLAGALLAALTPIVLKLAVDLLTAVDKLSSPSALIIVVSYVVGQYLSRLCVELRTFTFGQAEQRLRRRISGALFEHVVRLPMRLYLERKAGAIAETAEQGVRGYQLVLTHIVYTVLPVTTELFVVATVLVHFEQEKYLALLAASAITYLLAFRSGAIKIRAPTETASESHIEARGLLNDTLVNCETVKYFDAESLVCNRYDAALGRTEVAWRLFFRRRAGNGLVVATIFAISLGWSLCWALLDVIAGVMTVGGFVLVNTYVVRLVQPIEMLGFAIRDIAQGTAFLLKLIELFREKTECDLRQAESHTHTHHAELAFENVSFSYRRGRIVLKDVSFEVRTGSTVAVVGVSGSGKSSLIRLLFRLYEPDAGRILLGGKPISQMPLSSVRQAIAVVPQDTVLFHDTIARNIGFGRNGSEQWEIERAAQVANIHEFIMGLPEGYETMVGERGLKLSGGERQRVAIARAAIKRPRIFVFDEATSSLDTRTESEIQRNLIDSRETTTLVIAHRLSTVVHVDEIIVLDRSVIVERGNHANLLERNGYYAALWHAQQCGIPGANHEISVA